jgi:hypothetical protein
VFVTPDNIAYVVDAATCRVRRITPFPSVAESISCTASAAGYIRPSGCTSFDQPVDKVRQHCLLALLAAATCSGHLRRCVTT